MEQEKEPVFSPKTLGKTAKEGLSGDLLPEIVRKFSIASPEVQLARPLADFVASVLTTACRSSHSRRAYEHSIGLFLSFLDRRRGDRIPAPYALSWRPIAESYILSQQTRQWVFRGACVVLRLVDADLLGEFKSFRENPRETIGKDGKPKVEPADSANTVALRIAAVRTMLAVAYRNGIITSDQAGTMNVPSYRMRVKRDVAITGRWLTPDEVASLLSVPDLRAVKGRRDAAILDTLLYLALRAEELCNVRLLDFSRALDCWWITVTGKGKKSRKLKVHPDLMASLENWLDASLGRIGEGAGYLFRSITKGGTINEGPLDRSIIARMISAAGHAAGIAPEKGDHILSPHDLRRTAARGAFNAGADLLKVQSLLGHSDIKTTMRYIGANDDQGKTAVDYLAWKKR